LGLGPGAFKWDGRPIASDGRAARFEDGTLAGSATGLLDAVRNLVGWGVPLADAARMASERGAQLAGAGGRKGAIAPGFDADLVLLDRELRLAGVYCRGLAANVRLE